MESDDQPGGEGGALKDWRLPGKCGSCTLFETDFGDPTIFFGHCRMHLRTGARESTAYACNEYVPMAGFADLTRSAKYIPNSGYKQARSARVRGHGSSSPPSRTHESAPRPDPAAIRAQRRAGMDQLGSVLGTLFGGAGAPDPDAPGDPMEQDKLRDVLIDVIENFLGIEDVDLGDKWTGGTLTLQPSDPSLKPHEIPIETFFHKIVMVRDRLRVLEGKLNANEGLTIEDKVTLQQYISRCYGSLTTFNVLFKDKGDRFTSK